MSQNSQKRAHRGSRLTPEQRRRILREQKKRAMRRKLYLAFGALGALLAALIVVIVLTHNGGANMRAPLAMEAGSEAAVTAAPEAISTSTPEPATPEPTDTPAPATPEPTSTPEPTPTPEPTIPAVLDERIVIPLATLDPAAPFSYEGAYVAAIQGANTGDPVTPDYSGIDSSKLERWPSADAGFMLMLTRANTDQNIIAVTVDDCFQADNLRQIVKCALKNDARLTIFPIGENLEKPSVAEVVKAAWEKGMEIENHTYSHKGTYHYDDEQMTDDIWRQSYLLNQVLGVNYKQHFFRPKGGDERFDQRTHAYVNQLGFSAIALWTQSGSVDPMDSLLSNLGPGRIYLFHTTDNDLNKLLQFIPAAVKRGYRLVTLNEMFGLPANETADLSTASSVKPALAAFQVQPMALKTTAYARAAAVVQKRLIDLGWMKGEATGVYGKTTHASMALFQAAAGIEIDGEASVETQKLLFSDEAPIGSDEQIRELMGRMSAGVQDSIREMMKS